MYILKTKRYVSLTWISKHPREGTHAVYPSRSVALSSAYIGKNQYLIKASKSLMKARKQRHQVTGKSVINYV